MSSKCQDMSSKCQLIVCENCNKQVSINHIKEIKIDKIINKYQK